MEVTTIGIDLAKSVFEVCGADARGKVVLRQQLRRAQLAGVHAASLSRAWWGWRRVAERTLGRAR